MHRIVECLKDLLIFKAKLENSKKRKIRTLHRNLQLKCNQLLTAQKNILKHNKINKYIIKTQTLIFLKKTFYLLTQVKKITTTWPRKFRLGGARATCYKQ